MLRSNLSTLPSRLSQLGQITLFREAGGFHLQTWLMAIPPRKGRGEDETGSRAAARSPQEGTSPHPRSRAPAASLPDGHPRSRGSDGARPPAGT